MAAKTNFSKNPEHSKMDMMWTKALSYFISINCGHGYAHYHGDTLSEFSVTIPKTFGVKIVCSVKKLYTVRFSNFNQFSMLVLINALQIPILISSVGAHAH